MIRHLHHIACKLTAIHCDQQIHGFLFTLFADLCDVAQEQNLLTAYFDSEHRRSIARVFYKVGRQHFMRKQNFNLCISCHDSLPGVRDDCFGAGILCNTGFHV